MPGSLLDAIEGAANHVRRQGVVVDLEIRPPPSAATIREAKAACSITLSDSLIEVYRVIGDGFSIRWAEDEELGPSGMACFASLQSIADGLASRKRYAVEWDDSYDFQFTKDADRAKRTALRMRRWLEFHREGNGDGFCLEVADQRPVVVFNKHDWFDGGDGGNGAVVASSLSEWIESWSRMCFQRPSGLWWPRAIGDDGVDWSGGEFDSRFAF